MTIVVDANILFSALITPNGKIAKILGNPNLGITRLSCHFLIKEIHKHREKIVKASKRTELSVMDDLFNYLKYVRVYDETFLETSHLKEAKRLTEDVDLYDMDYVALALQTNAFLWTGDKKLIEHLITMGFKNVLNTAELATLLNVD